MYTRRLRSMSSNEVSMIGGGSGPRKYLCNDCSRTFALKASLLRHKAFECNKGRQPYERQSQDECDRSRKSKKKHVCVRCNRVYAFFTSLWRHQKYECGVEPKFVCPICKGRFAQKSNLDRFAYGFRKPQDATNTPLTQVSPLSPLMCPQCGRTYKMKRNLKTHMKFECGGQRNFMCHLCPSKYTQNISLRRHLLQRHNLYMPPKFSVPKRFYESFHPAENPAVHGRKAHAAAPTKIARVKTSPRCPGNAEDQALQCSACGKKYSLKHNLARHMRFECGGQRRFSCHLCPNKYTQNVSLRRHLTHHHNIMVPVKKRHNSSYRIVYP
ncbi:zinc finger protein 425-like [Temnothorax curvispinosus]|uniref:Zinc finger protein 425-like n=1 Tax=Temnothorax curvispinosus TaxID=300111 RepID=A0A6J1R5Q8_9HYME|nr:zinc finger protein 425-like [Temnothorax curvispinosus]